MEHSQIIQFLNFHTQLDIDGRFIRQDNIKVIYMTEYRPIAQRVQGGGGGQLKE